MKRLYLCMELSVIVKRWREKGVVVEIDTLDVAGSLGGLVLIVLGTTHVLLSRDG